MALPYQERTLVTAALPHRRQVTVEEYNLMAEAGVFGEEERIELLRRASATIGFWT